MIHNWYFKDKNPLFEFNGLKFQIQIFSDTNRYDLDASKCVTTANKNTFIVDCSGLQWAGGQENDEGSCNVKVVLENGKYLVDIKASKNEKIRKVKLVLKDEKLGTIIARRRYESKINKYGEIFRYPNGWDDLFTPLITIKNDNDVRYYRSLDNVVRPKIFMVKEDVNNALVELVFEEDSRHLSNTIIVPTWEIGNANNTDEVFEMQRLYVEKIYGCKPFELRDDVAPWAKNISLVLSIHAMHWSGHIFNTYKMIEEKLKWFAKRIDPKNVLVYIPGFDGRYYYKYSNYDPDERLGGKKGLRHLMNYAHKVGYHVMPMFMSNGANPNEKGFKKWGLPSQYYQPNGYVNGVGSCDWDTGRGYSLGCGVALNPGAPKWQDKIVKEILKQIDRFHFDAIFLDLAAIYTNDPYHSTHEGIIKIIDRLHEKYPELLVSTEGWYDALTPYFPLSQCGADGSRLGEMIYHDTPYDKFFDTYNRSFAHLCLGDLAHNYNGVFEWGINPSTNRFPLRKGCIQTITVLDDTVKIAEDKILEVIDEANEYKKLYIK